MPSDREPVPPRSPIRNDSGVIRWWADAACATRPDLPWDTNGDGLRAQEAAAVCGTCPVLALCAEETKRVEVCEVDVCGVRAGLMAPERQALLEGDHGCPDCPRSFGSRAALSAHRSKAHGWIPECGTPGGYQRHRKLGTATCPECRAAHVADQKRAAS